MATKKTVPEDVRQKVTLYHRVYPNREGKVEVHEDLDVNYVTSDGRLVFLTGPQERRRNIAVLGTVTDDDKYDWRHLDVYASHKEEDDWYDEDHEDEEKSVAGYEHRGYLAGYEVEVQNISASGRTGVSCGANYYGAMPVGSVEVDLTTIHDPKMRELARQMLTGTYTPPAPTQEELDEIEVDGHARQLRFEHPELQDDMRERLIDEKRKELAARRSNTTNTSE